MGFWIGDLPQGCAIASMAAQSVLYKSGVKSRILQAAWKKVKGYREGHVTLIWEVGDYLFCYCVNDGTTKYKKTKSIHMNGNPLVLARKIYKHRPVKAAWWTKPI